MAVNKICFVISPIGEKGTETRKSADDLLELVIEPALQPFGFEVIRADKIVSAGVITSEIIEYVQTADLCIIDLTGNNANVFYECGRRHETARPFIQVIRAGERLPFDVAGIRTIFYDLTDPRAVHNTVIEVRKYVEAVAAKPSLEARSAVSVASLAETIDRLERKIDQLGSPRDRPSEFAMNTRLPAGALDTLKDLVSHRSRSNSFMDAIALGNIEGASVALQRMREKSGLVPQVVAAAAVLAATGDASGKNVLFEALDTIPADQWEDEDGEEEKGFSRVGALLALANYYTRTNDASEGVARLKDHLVAIAEDASMDTKQRAMAANALQMIAYAADMYELAIEYGNKATALHPTERTYLVNLAMCYEAVDNLAKAKECIDRGLAVPLSSSSPFALSEAIDIYHELGDVIKVEELLQALEVADPERARVKRFYISLQSSVNPSDE